MTYIFDIAKLRQDLECKWFKRHKFITRCKSRKHTR